jgi:hypothetical protein
MYDSFGQPGNELHICEMTCGFNKFELKEITVMKRGYIFMFQNK